MASTAFCPECHRKVEIDDPTLGQFITCPHCQTELEIIYLDPLQLDWIEEDEEKTGNYYSEKHP
jgi:lysine biosynthesis protein LysW